MLRADKRTAVFPGKLKLQINLRYSQSISTESQIGRAIIFPPSKPPYQLSEIWKAGDNWVAQYLRDQPTRYVFPMAIGKEILESNGVAEEKIENRKFGYGNKGMLLATLVNVPTQTIPLIRESGAVNGTGWEALLPRKKNT